MTAPRIHGRWSSFSVSKAVSAIGDTLADIRREDDLTWKELGRILGKSDDRASDYANGLSEMPVGVFLLACREWNGRFANGVLSMIGMSLVPNPADGTSDTDKLAHIAKLGHLIAAAIADKKTPGVIDDDELETISDEDLDEASLAIAAIRARKARNVVKLEAVA